MIAQSQLRLGITTVRQFLTSLLKKDGEENVTPDSNEIITLLVDAGRILTDFHHRMLYTRRTFLVLNLNVFVKNIIEDYQVSTLHFGDDFAERIKTTQLVEKTEKQLLKQSSISSPGSSNKKAQAPRSDFNTHYDNLNSKDPLRKNFRSTSK